jgi:hypothetical protein
MCDNFPVGPMKATDATNLQKLWGNEPCDHPDAIALQSTDGVSTDIWHCTQCGYVIDIDAWLKTRGTHD